MASNIQKYKKYRFIKQRDTFSCGPIAIINIYKWAGYLYSYKEVKYISKLIGTCPPHFVVGLTGTWSTPIDQHLKKSKLIKYNGYKHGFDINTLKNIDRHLDNNGCCLVNIYWKKNGGGHYFVIVGHTKTKYAVINYGAKMNTVALVDKKEIAMFMKNDVLDAEGFHPACTWFLNKL